MSIEARIKELNIVLQEVNTPKFSYIPVNQTGNLVYTSGQDCRVNGELILKGKLGKDLTIEEGQKAARQCVINCLSVLKWHLGSLDRVKKIVKLLGFVQSEEGFKDQPYVMNGASDLLIDVFGEKGKHARSAIGTNELPFDTPVEIEIIVEVEE
ncbi:RidA family protein [Metabacillus arenae]|uniref:RidA family protein n=1 Tax=Metabacillus arenae TaxID=2771434 RepID=A0A926RYQ8_9BACI|nr:RidA family protein [Metabacillus arenae]MBD1382025.1 RidA family protein [Metabacillus arenae]